MLVESSVNNVVVTKLRALYGKRLKTSDYDKLINKYSVSEVASYLKTETLYKSTLESINENFIHRGQIELLLKIANFEKYIKFNHYRLSQNAIFRYIILKNELDQMLAAIRLFNAGTMKRYAIHLPVFLLKYTKMNLKEIANIENFDDLVNIAKDTIYFKPLKKFKPEENKIDVVMCETELRKVFCREIISMICQDQNALNVLLLDIELFNISVIYRLKKYFNKDKEYIKSCLLPFFYYLNEDIINQMTETDNIEDLYKIILKTKYKKYCNQEMFSDVDFLGKKMLYKILTKDIRFTNSQLYIMMCYIYLMEIELRNIITVIECIDYKFSPDEIKKLLII